MHAAAAVVMHRDGIYTWQRSGLKMLNRRAGRGYVRVCVREGGNV